MAELKKIGIMGGTFDPIHIGHLIIAWNSLTQLGLNKVLFMPSGNPPHKNLKKITDAALRSDMVKIAIDGNEKFVYSDFELKREGIIYTSDTLRLMKKQNDRADLYFIMGADSLLDIEKWHEPDKIFESCKIVVADRDGNDKNILNIKERLFEKYHAEIYYIKSPLVNVSSSYIRECLAEGGSIKYLVPDGVEEYIKQNHIYT